MGHGTRGTAPLSLHTVVLFFFPIAPKPLSGSQIYMAPCGLSIGLCHAMRIGSIHCVGLFVGRCDGWSVGHQVQRSRWFGRPSRPDLGDESAVLFFLSSKRNRTIHLLRSINLGIRVMAASRMRRVVVMGF